MSDIYHPMFIKPTITRVPSGFSGYIWHDTKMVLNFFLKLFENRKSNWTRIHDHESLFCAFVHVEMMLRSRELGTRKWELGILNWDMGKISEVFQRSGK